MNDKYVNISINDFSKICRVCLSNDTQFVSMELLDLFVKVTNIQVYLHPLIKYKYIYININQNFSDKAKR